jgi:hypothetical protein
MFCAFQGKYPDQRSLNSFIMKKSYLQAALVSFLLALVVIACTDHVEPIPEPTQLTLSSLHSELVSPLGIDKDDKGNLWVSEIGNGGNTGSITMISPDGSQTLFATGFTSAKGPEGGFEGMSHVLYNNGKLYILHGIDGKLFIADVSNFKSGDPARDISSFEEFEYGTEIRKMHLPAPADDNSNLYALTMGPDGHIYMTDAGSNAVFKRDKDTGKITLFAKIPKVGTDPLIVDAVPTGIVFDGSKFLVSTLSGGPFVPGSATVFAVSLSGEVSVYKTGFTTLTHLVLTANNKPLLLHFADFNKGFQPMTGAILNEDGTVLLDGLTMPTDIKRTGDREFVLVNMPAGTVEKLTY